MFAAVCGAPAHGETFEELKGLSVEVSFDWRTTYRDLSTGTYRTSSARHVLRVYISSKGRIFDFIDVARTSNPRDSFRITMLDKAGEQRDGGMYTWTMVDGHLTRIHQIPEGLRTFTITINKDKLTCEFTARDEPDRKTGRIVPFPGKEQIIGLMLNSYKCTVKQGNIFGDDQ
jgi:hypothetical protein